MHIEDPGIPLAVVWLFATTDLHEEACECSTPTPPRNVGQHGTNLGDGDGLPRLGEDCGDVDEVRLVVEVVRLEIRGRAGACHELLHVLLSPARFCHATIPQATHWRVVGWSNRGVRTR